MLAEFFVVGVEGFGDAVGVEREGVTRAELALFEIALPLLECAHDRGGGFQAKDGIVGTKEKRGKVATVDVTDAAGGVVELSEEERGEGSVGGIFAEKLIDGAEQAAEIGGHSALTSQVGL